MKSVLILVTFLKILLFSKSVKKDKNHYSLLTKVKYFMFKVMRIHQLVSNGYTKLQEMMHQKCNLLREIGRVIEVAQELWEQEELLLSHSKLHQTHRLANSTILGSLMSDTGRITHLLQIQLIYRLLNLLDLCFNYFQYLIQIIQLN